MDRIKLRRAIARTPLAPVAAFPKRLRTIARYDAKVLRSSVRWLVKSREHHNYTYDLTPLSRNHLAWFVSVICDIPVKQVRAYLDEIESDDTLRQHLLAAIAESDRRRLADKEIRYARRIGWYAIVRAARPKHVVETGVDKGLGSVVLAAALLRNAAEGHPGRVTSLDINPEAGYLARVAPWSEVVDLVIGDSLASIAALDRPVDLFLHDSDHRTAHERREFDAVEPKLAPGAILLTDNVTITNVLAQHAESTGRRFLAFRETPANHWYPGDGIGVAW
ncbi:O-methyltransferase [Micromonospora endolithica]|uniref:Class I SAM-dependent methyltransferase n=1 Tax=Micromonospora endolithica TaxID=230091 RepID=A0A3A9ZMJ4_9ACTN|nr:class I SAM-dependent methyltransferase [Micromonospora endolithica]RKN49508.1 class I SAM-dependent methyltransferase [Micromonospora endolithica]TWJ23717.1 putative O-methyltransferase YrrM [Micromonospora endolithica]